MSERVEIDIQKLYNDLIELCKTPGPTQACVRVSENDPRIDGEFPMERTVKEIVHRINQEEKTDLHVITHMGNLVIVGGLGEIHMPPKQEEIEKIKKIPVVFGAHLDEITYIVRKRQEDDLIKDFARRLRKDPSKIFKIIPICNPPKLSKVDLMNENEKEDYIENNIFANKFFVDELINSECRVVGFRGKKFKEKIAKGRIYKVRELQEEIKIEDGEIKISLEPKDVKYLLFELTNENEKVLEGDMVIQDYGEWKREENHRNITENTIIKSKALDDRVGCVACIWAVKELSKRNIPAKAILTSSEEGVPEDVSWGRFVRSTYKEFCTDETITIVCDGMDGKNLKEFSDRNECLSEAVIVPYTSNGKGGGDVGVFSLLRDEVIHTLKETYGTTIAVTSTDYSSRSYEVKIMDRWTLIGFVQWTCGVPNPRKENEYKMAICHNNETVKLAQIANIIRTFICISEILRKI